jgi:hypothetical protein
MEDAMQLDRSQVICCLEQRGEHDTAQQAARHLPATIDTDEQGGLLAQNGISTVELVSKFGGDVDEHRCDR